MPASESKDRNKDKALPLGEEGEFADAGSHFSFMVSGPSASRAPCRVHRFGS